MLQIWLTIWHFGIKIINVYKYKWKGISSGVAGGILFKYCNSLSSTYYNMPTRLLKYGNFFPERVYHCPCLKKALDEIYNVDIRRYREIRLAIWEGTAQFYCVRVEDKLNCLFLCQTHLVLTLFTEVKYRYNSENKKDLVFMEKRYCKSCVRRYCDKLCNIYSFKFVN